MLVIITTEDQQLFHLEDQTAHGRTPVTALNVIFFIENLHRGVRWTTCESVEEMAKIFVVKQ